ncbi:ATP-grasp domain-containing protein [Candidatus Dojkabacteria bacterium]|uniref:ATP-grasp domain-containing protein n=1 Tax=Candidatus Dojkabacteria bacterium TaxID=2099670 RepID=A0A847VDT6_9BACT|nr:ATP-grasp domain-containing protein [Candidatus Dojkabacteria bacterium]
MAKTYDDYLEQAGNVHLAYYIQAADSLGIKYSIVVPKLIAKFETQSKHWYIINTATPLTSTPSTTIAKRKNLTNKILHDFNIPVPTQRILTSKTEAINFFKEYKNIVIKPTQQLGGSGVTLLPKTKKEVVQAYFNALSSSKAKSDSKVIGEEFIEGENYRLLVLGNNVIGIVRRKPAFVIGNGKDSIEKLIKERNRERKRSLLKPITIDNEVKLRLQHLNIKMSYIPKENEEVVLRYNCNLTTGGTTQECASETHWYYKDIAIKAVHAIGAQFGGVDIITPDISKPAKCAINEINYNPGLRLHYRVDKGAVVDVATPIIKYISKIV